MTNEQMRIVIAEACGGKWYEWKDLPRKGICFQMPNDLIGTNQQVCNRPNDWINRYYYNKDNYPNYPLDLNACHEMEKNLKQVQVVTYQDILVSITCKTEKLFPNDKAYPLDGFVIAATSQQRCEAFIKTVCPEKWIN